MQQSGRMPFHEHDWSRLTLTVNLAPFLST
jgi:hypothetical protein